MQSLVRRRNLRRLNWVCSLHGLRVSPKQGSSLKWVHFRGEKVKKPHLRKVQEPHLRTAQEPHLRKVQESHPRMKQMKSLRLKLEKTFERHAIFVATHAWKIAITCFVLNVLFGFGLLTLELNNDIEDIYFPIYTKTEDNAKRLSEIFPDTSDKNFYEHTSIKQPMYGEVIIRTVDNKNVFNATIMKEVDRLIDIVYKNVSVKAKFEEKLFYSDLCARRDNECVVSGMEFIKRFKDKTNVAALVGNNNDSERPVYDPKSFLGDYTLMNGTELYAKYLKLRFYLRQETEGKKTFSRKWEYRFTEKMKRFESDVIRIIFRHASSFYEELGWDTYPDIPYFSLAFTVLLTYCGFLISGGDCVTKRVHMGRVGILATPLALLGGWGFLSGCGISFTDTIGMMPFLAMCHQLHNIMLALSALNDVGDEPAAVKRVAHALRLSGVPVTITTLCHVITFMIGLWSGYKVVRIVSTYTVVTFIFNYVNHMIFFTSCLALHERRIDSLRHCCTCRKLESREKLREAGAPFCTICCCSGRRPTSREQIESPMEKLARILLSRYILTPVMKGFAIWLFICYIAASIYGLINMNIDSIQPKEVKDISYFSKFETLDLNHFPREYIVTFAITKPFDYQNHASRIENYISQVETQEPMQPDVYYWLKTFQRSLGFSKRNSTNIRQLKNNFLHNNAVFKSDIIFAEDNKTVLASRFYMKTVSTPSTKEMIQLKEYLKNLYLLPNDYIDTKNTKHAYKVDGDDDDDDDDDDEEDALEEKLKHSIILANSPDFIHTDSYRLPLKEIIRIAAGYLTTMCVFTLILVPHPLLPFHMAIMFVTFLLGVIGISHFVGIYMTPVSMIVIMICSGYGTEVIVHSYYTYMTSMGTDRGSRTFAVLSTTSPILFHTNFASFLGLLVLIIVQSYVFQVVFRLLEVSSAVCILYAVFFIPVALAFIGPGSISLPSSSKIVRRSSRAAKNIFDQVGTQMNNGPDPILKPGDQVKNGGLDNPGFEKV